MPNKLLEYQLRIRNAADSADAVTVTSVRGGTNPYISAAPTGDGASLDPYTGRVESGSFTGRLVDPITSGTTRFFTSLLEDGNFRQQLGQRKAYWEFRVDGGGWQVLCAGRLASLRTVGVEWEITVSDWMRAEHDFSVFDAHDGDTIAGYLARWPNRGCLLGGPVMGSFLNFPDLGGWEMRVHEVSNNGANFYTYWLEPRTVYGPGAWVPGSNIDLFARIINDAMRDMPRAAFDGSYTSSFSSVRDTQMTGLGWSGLVALVNGTAYRPVPPIAAGRYYEGNASDLISPERGKQGIFLVREEVGQPLLTDGSIVKGVRVLTIMPSPLSPIYWTGHPTDLLSTLWGEAGFPYSTSALTTLKNLIGTSVELAAIFDRVWKLGNLAEDAVYGPFGVGVRTNATAQLEAFSSRTFTNTLPATTITSADVVQEETSAFELDAETAIRRVSMEDTMILQYDLGGTVGGVLTRSRRYERINGDPASIGTGDQEYTIPAFVRFVGSADGNFASWVDARAYEMLDRRGRGAIGAETLLLRGGAGDSVSLGDEILFDPPQLPNHNKRVLDDPLTAVARAMQIVKLTPEVRGKRVRLEDSGPNAQPIITVPTHSIAASTLRPRNVANLTITNAATLNASVYAVRVQIAITTGAVPAATDYGDALYFTPGNVPVAAFALPQAYAGRTVYARARTEIAGSRPSNWSVGVGVTLSALNAPTGLSAVAVGTDGSYEDLAWTPGASTTDCQTEIWIRPSGGAFATTATRQEVLLPGSTRYRVQRLTPNTAYTATVRHRDPQTGDLSANTEVTFTTANVTYTMLVPAYATGFSGLETAS